MIRWWNNFIIYIVMIELAYMHHRFILDLQYWHVLWYKVEMNRIFTFAFTAVNIHHVFLYLQSLFQYKFFVFANVQIFSKTRKNEEMNIICMRDDQLSEAATLSLQPLVGLMFTANFHNSVTVSWGVRRRHVLASLTVTKFPWSIVSPCCRYLYNSAVAFRNYAVIVPELWKMV